MDISLTCPTTRWSQVITYRLGYLEENCDGGVEAKINERRRIKTISWWLSPAQARSDYTGLRPLLSLDILRRT